MKGHMKEIFLLGGKLYPIVSEEIDNGILAIKEGKIAGVYKNPGVDKPDGSAELYEMNGMHILPGLVDAHTHLGILEESTGEIGQDNNETSGPVTPHLRAVDGVNPNDVGFRDALRAGVTAVMTGPGSNNPVGGLNIAVKTYGTIIDEMIIKNPAGLKLALGENPVNTYGKKGNMPITRMGIMALIREMFMKAQDYKHQKEKGRIDYRDPRMEAVLPVLNSEIPVRVHAHRADDMVSAVRLAEEFDLRLVIEHATEGHLIKEYLHRKDIAVTVGPMLTPRIKMELKNRSYRTAVDLALAGVKVALITDHPYNSIEHLRLIAAMAHMEGLPAHLALQAVTINPAGILNVDHRIGSLEVGKDADIVVLDGPPLSIESKVKMVFLDGRLVYKKRD